MENIILQTPPKAPIQSKTIEPESKTQRSVQQRIMDDEKDQTQKNPRNNEVCKPVTPDRLRVPKAFKYPERYTSPTDMMISPVTKGLLARSRKCGALLPPGKSLAKIPPIDLRCRKLRETQDVTSSVRGVEMEKMVLGALLPRPWPDAVRNLD